MRALKTPCQKEWLALRAREARYLKRRRERRDSALNRLLEKKIPEGLRNTLDTAFEKAFTLILDRGGEVLERTIDRDAIAKQVQIDLYADDLQGTWKSLRAVPKRAERRGGLNLAVSGVSGVGLGLLGIGLPDIPLFLCVMLRSVCEAALRYGFDCRSPEERYFMLLLVEGAASVGERLEEVDRRVESFLRDPRLPEGYDRREQIARTSRTLSGELLYMKFLQGVPVVGAVGGAYDAVYLHRVLEYAGLKYYKRFLIGRIRHSLRKGEGEA